MLFPMLALNKRLFIRKWYLKFFYRFKSATIVFDLTNISTGFNISYLASDCNLFMTILSKIFFGIFLFWPICSFFSVTKTPTLLILLLVAAMSSLKTLLFLKQFLYYIFSYVKLNFFFWCNQVCLIIFFNVFKIRNRFVYWCFWLSSDTYGSF